jgi:hypothetical protein
MSVGLLYFELDLDTTKFIKEQNNLNAKIKNLAQNTNEALQLGYQNLGVRADAYYQLQANLAIKSYEKITQAAKQSADEQYRAQSAMVAKINALNQQMAASPGMSALGIRSTEQLIQERLGIMRVHEMEKAAAAGNARDIEAIEVATKAKLTALDNEYMAVTIANDAKRLASATATSEKIRAQGLMELEAATMMAKSKRDIQEKWASDEMAVRGRLRTEQEKQAAGYMSEMEWQKKMEATKSEAWAENAKRTRDQGLMQIQATKDDVERTKKATADKIAATNEHYNTLGMKSAASINEQIANVTKAATAQQLIVGKSSEDWIRIERAKNEKLKELNKEMTGQHEMSMASMTRAVLRFYAAYYVLSTVGSAIKDLFMGGIKAIDEMQFSAISIATTITSMQGTTGNVAENYKKNLEYAKGIVPVLQQIDANSFANLQEIMLMNTQLALHGVLLDGNNKKQVESATALSNAIKIFTSGQDPVKQMQQETRAIFTGMIKPGDTVAMMLDSMIKNEGKYAGGLKEIVKLSRDHADMLERINPYLVGIVAGVSDIQKTWMAVSSSMETSWNIIQRGLFADFYKSLTKSGSEANTWLKKNADDIVASIDKIGTAIKIAFEVAILAMSAFAIATWAAMIKAGDAMAWFALRWEVLTTKVTLATSKMRLGFNIFSAAITGAAIGTYLSDQFEWARFAGIAMVYGVINAWEWFIKQLKVGWEYIKLAKDYLTTMRSDERAMVTRMHQNK